MGKMGEVSRVGKMGEMCVCVCVCVCVCLSGLSYLK